MERPDELEAGKTRRRFKRLHVLILVIAVAIAFLAVSLWPRNPRAVIRIVDDQNKPIAGATIRPYAMRPKRQGGHSGHYAWLKDRHDVPPLAVVTDEMGTGIVPYPKFVAERVETSLITVSVEHPRYTSDTRDILVSTSLPSGAPWALRLKVILNRLKNGPVTRPGPIVLEQGQTLILKPAPPLATGSCLFAQTSSNRTYYDDDFWDASTPGMVVSREHALGKHAVRLIGLSETNQLMFSDTVDVTIEPGVANTRSLTLTPGKTVRGRLSSNVPRPVADGRVVANVVPAGRRLCDDPPEWHAWTNIKEDGSFEIHSLPPGDLEIAALCNGFINASPPGQRQSSTFYYPQKHVIDANDLDIVIEMEPTARLEVTVDDDNGRPLEGARAGTWPNVRWDDCSATIFCSDLYNTIDHLQRTNNRQDGLKQDTPPGFFGLSDKTGLAILSNVPANQTLFAVDHPDYVLPKVAVRGGAPRRHASINLQPGAVTETSVTLEPRNKDPQRHY
jgi:hypothetical protein